MIFLGGGVTLYDGCFWCIDLKVEFQVERISGGCRANSFGYIRLYYIVKCDCIWGVGTKM